MDDRSFDTIGRVNIGQNFVLLKAEFRGSVIDRFAIETLFFLFLSEWSRAKTLISSRDLWTEVRRLNYLRSVSISKFKTCPDQNVH